MLILLDNSLQRVLNVIREFSPNSKSYSENPVQTVLLEHSGKTVFVAIKRFSANSTKYQTTHDCDGVANYIACCFLVFGTGIWHLRHGNQEALHHDY